MRLQWIGSLAMLVGLLPAGVQAAAPNEVEAGVVAAVNTAATGVPPTRPLHLLSIGSEVVHNERITTDAHGQTQLLFLDGSTFTIGDHADVVIDEFVFDPKAGKGKLALNVARGAFRFVGGKLSKDGSVQVTTPSAVLGIRGAIVTGEVSEEGGTTASLHYGQALSVTGRTGQPRVVSRPGFEVAVPSAGMPAQQPRRVTGERLAATVAHLTGRAGANGGAAVRPSSDIVAAALKAPASHPLPEVSKRASDPAALAHQSPAPPPQAAMAAPDRRTATLNKLRSARDAVHLVRHKITPKKRI